MGHSLVPKLIRSLASSLTRGKVNHQLSQNDLVLSHSALKTTSMLHGTMRNAYLAYWL